jgi:hypothetical protein
MTAQPTVSDRPRRCRRPTGGRAQLLTIGVSLGLIAVVGVTIWRARSLDGLPDVGDPFDVAEARRTVELPDADNAFVAYAAAARQKLMNPGNPIHKARWQSLYDAVWVGEIKALTWSSAEPAIRDYLEDKRAAIEIWREGSRRRDALYQQPSQLSVDGWFPLLGDTIILAGLAALEGSRLEDAGARDEAWDWFHAMLRSSRLVGRHGSLTARCYGARIHALAARCILRWAAGPRIDAGRLRGALDDVLAADALTPPLSEAMKLDYLICMADIEDMSRFEATMRDFGRALPLLGGRKSGVLDAFVPRTVRIPVQRFRLRAGNDVERSRRLMRLLFANWLAQVDRPAGHRAPPAVRKPIWIFADDPSAPPAARAGRPEFLAQMIDRTEMARFLVGPEGTQIDPRCWEDEGELARERRRRSVLIVRLAAEIYRREHGAHPTTAGALVGSVLKDLPEGIPAPDPIPAGLD